MPCYVRAALFMFNLFDMSVSMACFVAWAEMAHSDTDKTAMRGKEKTHTAHNLSFSNSPSHHFVTEFFVFFAQNHLPFFLNSTTKVLLFNIYSSCCKFN